MCDDANVPLASQREISTNFSNSQTEWNGQRGLKEFVLHVNLNFRSIRPICIRLNMWHLRCNLPQNVSLFGRNCPRNYWPNLLPNTSSLFLTSWSANKNRGRECHCWIFKFPSKWSYHIQLYIYIALTTILAEANHDTSIRAQPQSSVRYWAAEPGDLSQ